MLLRVILRDEAAALQRVQSFLLGGLDSGGQAIVIAMPEHAQALRKALPSQRVQWLDAEQTLSRLLVDGWPDEDAFQHTIGNLMRSATQRAPTWVYGEMVAVLCLRGNHAAAVRLEQLWNKLLQDVGGHLLLGYPRRVFARPADARRFNAALQQPAA